MREGDTAHHERMYDSHQSSPIESFAFLTVMHYFFGKYEMDRTVVTEQVRRGIRHLIIMWFCL